jgi:hypothetical protein
LQALVSDAVAKDRGPISKTSLDQRRPPIACYWLVNANLKLATLILPDRPWRIVLSSFHSTTWDGDECLFDMTGQALYGDADKAFAFAFACAGLGRLFDPGVYLEVKPAPRDERIQRLCSGASNRRGESKWQLIEVDIDQGAGSLPE